MSVRTPLDAAPESREPSPASFKSFSKLSGVGAVGGICIYTLLRISYGAFYGAFGVTPEDVGLDYPDLIFQSIVGLVVLGFLVVIGVVVWGFADLGVTAFLNRRARRRHKAGKRGSIVPPVSLRQLAVGAFVIFCLLLLLGEIPRQASEFAERGKSGRAVTWAGFRVDAIVSDKFPLLAYRAEPAEISLLGPHTPAEEQAVSSSSLMYLGSGSETHIFFDHESEELLRVPVRSSVIVSRDVSRGDPYDFPSVVFFALPILLVFALRVAEVVRQDRRLSAAAEILGVKHEP